MRFTMISSIIELTLLLSDSSDSVTIVTENNEVIDALEKYGKLLAQKTGVKHLKIQKFNPEGFRKNFSVNYEKIEEEFGEDTPVVVGQIAMMSFESVKKNIQNGFLEFIADGKKFRVNSEYLKESFKYPKEYTVKHFSQGYVFFEGEKE